MTDGPIEHGLELTVSALKDGALDLGLHGGLTEIRRWEDLLAGSDAPALTEVAAGLAELRGELESEAPDTAVVADLLRRLGGQTLAVAEPLEPGDTQRALRELGNLLVREGQILPRE